MKLSNESFNVPLSSDILDQQDNKKLQEACGSFYQDNFFVPCLFVLWNLRKNNFFCWVYDYRLFYVLQFWTINYETCMERFWISCLLGMLERKVSELECNIDFCGLFEIQDSQDMIWKNSIQPSKYFLQYKF